jgi:hypothetical protein
MSARTPVVPAVLHENYPDINPFDRLRIFLAELIVPRFNFDPVRPGIVPDVPWLAGAESEIVKPAIDFEQALCEAREVAFDRGVSLSESGPIFAEVVEVFRDGIRAVWEGRLPHQAAIDRARRRLDELADPLRKKWHQAPADQNASTEQPVAATGRDAGPGQATAPQYVTRDQMAAICGLRSKKTIGRWINSDRLPSPDIEGGGGRADLWIWAKVRESLERASGRMLPQHYPSPIPPG